MSLVLVEELLVLRLVQISVRPEKVLLQKSLRSSNISPIADLMGDRLINLVYDDKHRTAPRLAGIFEDDQSAESVFHRESTLARDTTSSAL
ncbi:hypothetical protein M405DRAFT_811540 [Rhizopogon salebrosus TDB-379]|nr:hypothetical protein M405DRAFT_811540 [Rhizopogon salebrosus TDB-379]